MKILESPHFSPLVVEHCDGEGDGVDLVVVSPMRKAGGFFDEFPVPCPSNEMDAAFFGESDPRKGARDLVALSHNDAGQNRNQRQHARRERQ